MMLPLDFFDRALEAVGGAFDGLFVDAEGEAEEAGATKTPARHGEDVLLEEGVDKGKVVAAGRLGEEVERAARFGEGDAGIGKHARHGRAAAGVDGNVNLLVEELPDEFLPEDGRVDKTKRAGGHGDRADELRDAVERGICEEVADAFAGEGEAF